MSSEAIDRIIADHRGVAAGLPGRGRAVARPHPAKRSRLVCVARPSHGTGRGLEVHESRRHRAPVLQAGDRSAGAVTGDSGATSFAELPCHLLVFVDGRFDPTFSSIGSLPPACASTSLAEIVAQDPQRLRDRFSAPKPDNAFAALNTAFMTDGVDDRVATKRRGRAADPFALHRESAGDEPFIIAISSSLSEGAQATVVEHYAGPEGAAYLTNAVTTIVGAANSSVEHYKLQQESTKAIHVARDPRRRRAATAASHRHSIALGGRHRPQRHYDAGSTREGAECTLNGLYMVGGGQLVDHHTRIDHAKPRGTSREYYRGMLDGSARGSFQREGGRARRMPSRPMPSSRTTTCCCRRKPRSTRSHSSRSSPMT